MNIPTKSVRIRTIGFTLDMDFDRSEYSDPGLTLFIIRRKIIWLTKTLILREERDLLDIIFVSQKKGMTRIYSVRFNAPLMCCFCCRLSWPQSNPTTLSQQLVASHLVFILCV
jgi:hypothetical protein